MTCVNVTLHLRVLCSGMFVHIFKAVSRAQTISYYRTAPVFLLLLKQKFLEGGHPRQWCIRTVSGLYVLQSLIVLGHILKMEPSLANIDQVEGEATWPCFYMI